MFRNGRDNSINGMLSTTVERKIPKVFLPDDSLDHNVKGHPEENQKTQDLPSNTSTSSLVTRAIYHVVMQLGCAVTNETDIAH